ncbi:ABC transporter substrate-binding protein [Kitasatospora kifunensis]|uniref:Peptide/nickel transport system substrate-binding protein n=1 Tax=Kitasatospora kifunensis TaxID=58351 RepID=A0A7W7R068_KITKI|nr:ABC transporter substrate-binding protein [Kitasatospora kifunensis]MBB4922376.1 peptide/nickel transport system substrate-binding protein [Kitasatospora kifunensis]
MSSAIRRAPGRLAALGCAALVVTSLAGCGSVRSLSGGSSGAITLGTVNTTSVLDPAGAYDNGSWLILENTFQGLLRFPVGGTTPVPDAAQDCSFSADALTYHCTLRPHLTFSNGHPLTAQDVVFSVERMKKINDPSGPAVLFSTIKSVEAQGDSDVVFHLTEPDAVLPDKLAGAAGSIVDHSVFPADKELPNNQLVGSGPYKIDSMDETSTPGGGKSPSKISLSANGKYQGDEKPKSSKITVRYFTDPVQLKSALDSGTVDLVDNSLDPKVAAQVQADQLAGKGNLNVTQVDSSDSGFVVFNTKDQTMGQQAVRQAIAQLVDRDALTNNVFANTVEPLYSVVPQGMAGHNTAFFDKYGKPDPAKAKAILAAAKIPTPVSFTLSWSGTGAAGDEPAALKQELEAGGLFQVKTQQVSDWTAYQKGWQQGSYQAYTTAWSADYPDAEDFVAPLVVNGGAFYNGFDDPVISRQLLPQTQGQADRAQAAGTFAAIQNQLAVDVPMLPLVQSKALYAARQDITGVEAAVDSTSIIRFAELGRG